jgi:hypothetical protein
MKNLIVLLQEAQEYTEAYARTGITDPALLKAIFTSHLAYLLNDKYTGETK